MKRPLAAFLLGLLSLGCSADREIGLRFQAERDLSRVNRQDERLRVRPELAAEPEWAELAGDYESIAGRYLVSSIATDTSTAARQIQYVSAAALLRAAEIREQLRDTDRVDDIYGRLQDAFGHDRELAATVALKRGEFAERAGRFSAAVEYYQTAVDHLEPRIDRPGTAARVLELPLRMARLYAIGVPGDEKGKTQRYQAAADYYRRQTAAHPGAPLAMEAQWYLAEIALDDGEWGVRSALLESLDEQLQGVESPRRDPAWIRLKLAEARYMAGAGLETTRDILLSILRDYPDSEQAPNAALSLAMNAVLRGQTDEALGYLDRIRDDYSDDVEIASEALLWQGRVLERAGRWSEAASAFRSVGSEYPVSQAALMAPLEIVLHHERSGEQDAARASLDRAAEEYRDFIRRYPATQHTIFARQRLIEVLQRQGADDEAVTEMERLGEVIAGTREGMTVMQAAAQKAVTDLADTTKAISILDRIGALYPRTAFGDWAAGKAATLRGADGR